MADIKDQLKELLETTLKEAGMSLEQDAQELLAYTQERINHLQSMVGQPGFDEAVLVERDNVLLKAGLIAAGEADQMDARILALIQGILLVAVTAL